MRFGSWLVACDNCIPGNGAQYYPLLLGLVATSVLIATVIWAVSRRAAWMPRMLGRISAVLFALGPAAAFWIATTDLEVEGGVCGGALSASLEQGRPDQAALDETQLGCKHAGEIYVHVATAVAAVSVASGIATGLGAGVAARGSRRRAETPSRLIETA